MSSWRVMEQETTGKCRVARLIFSAGATTRRCFERRVVRGRHGTRHHREMPGSPHSSAQSRRHPEQKRPTPPAVPNARAHALATKSHALSPRTHALATIPHPPPSGVAGAASRCAGETPKTQRRLASCHPDSERGATRPHPFSEAWTIASSASCPTAIETGGVSCACHSRARHRTSRISQRIWH